ncbi:unnamed protein product [Closterium sp. Yama58-4]|nr:unnamed protein product [Closterium sp. Yama58-4]
MAVRQAMVSPAGQSSHRVHHVDPKQRKSSAKRAPRRSRMRFLCGVPCMDAVIDDDSCDNVRLATPDTTAAVLRKSAHAEGTAQHGEAVPPRLPVPRLGSGSPAGRRGGSGGGQAAGAAAPSANGGMSGGRNYWREVVRQGASERGEHDGAAQREARKEVAESALRMAEAQERGQAEVAAELAGGDSRGKEAEGNASDSARDSDGSAFSEDSWGRSGEERAGEELRGVDARGEGERGGDGAGEEAEEDSDALEDDSSPVKKLWQGLMGSTGAGDTTVRNTSGSNADGTIAGDSGAAVSAAAGGGGVCGGRQGSMTPRRRAKMIQLLEEVREEEGEGEEEGEREEGKREEGKREDRKREGDRARGGKGLGYELMSPGEGMGWQGGEMEERGKGGWEGGGESREERETGFEEREMGFEESLGVWRAREEASWRERVAGWGERRGGETWSEEVDGDEEEGEGEGSELVREGREAEQEEEQGYSIARGGVVEQSLQWLAVAHTIWFRSSRHSNIRSSTRPLSLPLDLLHCSLLLPPNLLVCSLPLPPNQLHCSLLPSAPLCFCPSRACAYSRHRASIAEPGPGGTEPGGGSAEADVECDSERTSQGGGTASGSHG